MALDTFRPALIADSVYGVEHGDVIVRYGGITYTCPEACRTANDLAGMIPVEGVQDGDFLVFTNILDRHGVTERSFFVTDVHRGAAVLTHTDLVEAYPDTYVTDSLASKILSVPQEEIAQFSAGWLYQYLLRRRNDS